MANQQKVTLSDARGDGGRIASLDGLRALSVCLVIAGHACWTVGFPTHRLNHVLGVESHFGVTIFFVISGFLITSLLLREQARNGSIDRVGFYRRRLFRIFPAAYCYITCVALLAHPSVKDLIYSFTYTMSYYRTGGIWSLGHLWSLSVEEQFYLLWPLVFTLGLRAQRIYAWLVMLLAPVARFYCLRQGFVNIDAYFPTVADSIAAGCLLAFYYPSLRRLGSKLTQFRYALPLALFTLWLPVRFAASYRLPIFLGGAVPVLVALCVFVAIERRDWLLNNRLVNFVGVLSYSLYLWQQPFLDRTQNHLWTSFPLNIGLAVGCAYLSYRLVEQPMLRFKVASTRRNKIREKSALSEMPVEEPTLTRA